MWDSKAAQRLDLYQRGELAKPSKLLQKQVILEALDEVNQRLEMSSNPVYYAWQLDGNRVKSFMDIHQNCRIIVVSQEKSFKGIEGLDQFQGFLQAARPRQDTEQIKPKPGTWI